jgi:hypothetical protein
LAWGPWPRCTSRTRQGMGTTNPLAHHSDSTGRGSHRAGWERWGQTTLCSMLEPGQRICPGQPVDAWRNACTEPWSSDPQRNRPC